MHYEIKEYFMILHKRLFCLIATLAVFITGTQLRAQEADQQQAGPLPTQFSVKLSGGYGLGRARQLYGYDASSEVWWSTGQGSKINLAFDVPLIQVVVVDPLDTNSVKVPVVGLELEVASGYDLSSGGKTNDPIGGGVFQTTTRNSSYIPVTLGLNARTNFGGGMPSIYVGAGGGVWMIGNYEEDVSYSNNSPGLTRIMHPSIPFGLYGALGFELPLMYDDKDANSMFDLFAEIRLTEMTTYVSDYDVTSGGQTTTKTQQTDPTSLYLQDQARSASNVSLSLGFKFNIY
jgi:hypothetical protein